MWKQEVGPDLLSSDSGAYRYDLLCVSIYLISIQDLIGNRYLLMILIHMACVSSGKSWYTELVYGAAIACGTKRLACGRPAAASIVCS